MRSCAVLRAALVVLAALGSAAPAAHAAVIGLSDQHFATFLDPRFQALGIQQVRLVVPWDVALTSPQTADRWLDTVAARGLEPLVAFAAAATDDCPDQPCVLPSVDRFRAAFAAFRARWPQVLEFTPWNEPNHPAQPTFASPDRAAEYYNAIREHCPECLLVAGDMLDSDGLKTWLPAYRAALHSKPLVWGLHNYGDTSRSDRNMTRWLLDNVSGQVWLTETGGIVEFSVGGSDVFTYDEDRGAAEMRRALRIAASSPRIKRAYVYNWLAMPADRFDSGLLRADGSARQSLSVLQAALAPAADSPGRAPAPPAADVPAADPAPEANAPAEKALGPPRHTPLLTTKRGLGVRVRCRAQRPCRGRLVFFTVARTGAPWRELVSAGFRIGAGRARVVRVRLRPRGWHRLARRQGALVASLVMFRPDRIAQRMWPLPIAGP